MYGGGGGQPITVKVSDDNGNLVEETITTLKQLIEHVQESYPTQEEKDKPHQPSTNVVNAIIRYAKKYEWEQDERYEYIYDNFEYLTGLDIDVVEKIDPVGDDDRFSIEDTNIINEALRES